MINDSFLDSSQYVAYFGLCLSSSESFEVGDSVVNDLRRDPDPTKRVY